jgi:hypothetical protein
MENQMSQREPDDTPESADAPTRKQGDYYYDDATGYEIYKPEDEDESEPDEPHKTAQRALSKERAALFGFSARVDFRRRAR